MEAVVTRFAAEGLEVEEISQRSSMPVEFVEMVLNHIKILFILYFF